MDSEHNLMAESSQTLILLPTTRFPIGEECKESTSINIHSTFFYLHEVKKKLSESLFNKLKNTFLGPIIKEGLRRGGGAKKGDGLGFSARLVHFLVARQIITTRKNELWFYFNNQPMRFTLREFHLITGLPYKAEDEDEDEDEDEVEEEFNCNIGDKDGHHRLAELIALLETMGDDAEESKLRIAMLVVLETIFLMRYGPSKVFFRKDYVEIAKNNIHTYPWGKVAFDLLVSSVHDLKFKVNEKGDLMPQDLKGFPMALQLWMLASVPALEKAFSRLESDNSAFFVCERYVATSQPSYVEVCSVAESKDATVISSFNAADEEEDENDDDLCKLMQLVKRGYTLTELDWKRKFIEAPTHYLSASMHDEDVDREAELDVHDQSEAFVSPSLSTSVHEPDTEEDVGQGSNADQSDASDVDELDKAGTLDEDAGQDSNADQSDVSDKFKHLNLQDGEPSAVETNTKRTRCGRVSKPTNRFSPSGQKPRSRRL